MDLQTVHRLHFAFTVTFHYLFPQLTMGLALVIVLMKTLALRGHGEHYNDAVRFWSKILGVSFVMGVVTGIPLEFQFGTNWSRFSAAAGGVIGQALALEGVFAFFLESAFLYGLLFSEKRLGPKGHWFSAVLVWLGTWMSGYFIVCANAWMQHPIGVSVNSAGIVQIEDPIMLFTNPWAWVQYAHTVVGTVITGSFTVAATSAFYLLSGTHTVIAKASLRVAVIVGFTASFLAAMPTGDLHGKMVAEHQPITFAAMEGHFHTENGVGLTLIGQPNMETLTLDNPVVIPELLSLLTHQRPGSQIRGLTDFDRKLWPDNVPLLYYSYHVMAGLGTLFIALMGIACLALYRGHLFTTRGILWPLMLAFPLPYIANLAGWATVELGRQPWLIYGVFRTADGYSQHVSHGNALFTLLGFMGLYAMLALLYFFVTVRIVTEGPKITEGH
jgi:cytochrome bd ubiquinol oxidase subunit I